LRPSLAAPLSRDDEFQYVFNPSEPEPAKPAVPERGSHRATRELVDSFNGSSNLQGTGTTIIDTTRRPESRLFDDLPQKLAQCPGGIGLSQR
jgi:hypothetical protein